jgi:hypothetical protein
VVQPPRAYTRAPSPVTVIPIPKLTKVESSSSTLKPVVRPSVRQTGPSPVVPIPPVQPRRFAKGTGPVTPSTATAQRPPAADATPELRIGDQTLPRLALPTVARTVALPSLVARKG